MSARDQIIDAEQAEAEAMDAERLVTLRASCNGTKPKSPEVRTAIANAERRVKGPAA